MKRRIKNPGGIHLNSEGKMVDKYGRVLTIDWGEFEKQRGKVAAPIITSVKNKNNKL